jgi:formate dehydrogenase major subunit
VPGLGTTYGRGAATTAQWSMADSDCIVIMGSNMAECHPVSFRFPMMAKTRKDNPATLIHIDPRFTRTSAMCDLHVPIRAGSDIAFLGALVNYIVNSQRWNTDPFFKQYVVNYTNAPMIIDQNFKDAEDLDGFFSGWDPNAKKYDATTWRYAQNPNAGQEPGVFEAGIERQWGKPGTNSASPDALRDDTLQDPRCVFQILKRHFARYTPEMVQKVCGCSPDFVQKVGDALLNNSGRDKTSGWCYAVGWTQHTTGVQMIRTAALIQALLGNAGRPGGGVLALRGHATIQGSTDIPTLYNLLPGYLTQPSIEPGKNHDTLGSYIAQNTILTSYWSNFPKFMISFLKSWFGDAATKDNDYGYNYIPKIDGDLSHIPMFIDMGRGNIKGMFAMGQNPAVGGQNARFQRTALSKLDWLVVRDFFQTETATFWKDSPEVKRGELKPSDIKTEVFFLPAAGVPEKSGSFTNTQRLLQWHDKAVDPPGDARNENWFMHHLFTRIRQLYEQEGTLNDDKNWAVKNTTINYALDGPGQDPRADDIVKEVNGWTVADKKLLNGFADLKDDGSTACGCWIYSGIYRGGENWAAHRKADPPGTPGSHQNWGFAWPANRRIMYNRASADPDGNPWSERKKYVWWDADKKTWTGLDVPDFQATKAPNTPAKSLAEGGAGWDTHSGKQPFLMQNDGRAWLFVPGQALKDGPMPTHYEPAESPVQNAIYKQQANPAAKYWSDVPLQGNPLAQVADPNFPIVLSTYRLTEHHLSGSMSRWLPWLAELQPELFCEISPELAAEKGINNTDYVTITTPRGEIQARALVTRRMRPFNINGKIVHEIGLPWHWGYQGVASGDVANDLTHLVAEPNVTIHEGKVFTCNLRAGKRGA